MVELVALVLVQEQQESSKVENSIQVLSMVENLILVLQVLFYMNPLH